MTTADGALELPIRRAKLRSPRAGRGLVLRPRLTARLERSLHVPLTLVAAPAGYGKTTLLAEWAATHAVPLAWLTLDASDRDLKRFVLHLVAAIETLGPGIGAPVLDLTRRPHPVGAAEIGASLAEALFDHAEDMVLVIDDYHLAASADVERFLTGLLQTGIPALHLILATRNDPALPLARMRLHGQVNELRAADLRFTDEEAQALLAAAGHADGRPALVAALQQQTGGWIAGLRLATLALPAGVELTLIAGVIADDQHVMDFLVEEVLATQTEMIQDFLLRTAIVDRVSASLADALLDQTPPGGSRTLLDRLVHESLFLEQTDKDGEWFRYHPLFRSLLRHQLEIRLSPHEIAALHVRASVWFAAWGFLDLAIHHRVVAGDMTGAAELVERHVHTALDREDWTTLAGWLDLLPEDIIHGRPALLLARGWVSHFSGRSAPIRGMLVEIEALTKAQGDDAATLALRAECDALSIAALLATERDPHATVAVARRAVEHIPASHRLAAGLASYGLGCALQAIGRSDEAIQWLTAVTERDEDRIDAGSIRGLGGLMFVHRQAGNFRACAEVAEDILTLARRHGLPVATGWAHWMLGWLAYERNELETATEHFSAIVADDQRVHLHCACEAMFGLALTYQASGKPVETASTMRRLLEIVFDANALEYLPLIRGFEARLALVQGRPRRAIDWLEMEDVVAIEGASLDAFDHPYLTRIKVLLAEGSAESLAWAWRDLEALRAWMETRHHGAHLIETLALSALALDAKGHTGEALTALLRSVELAAPAGFFRTYADLGPALPPLLRRLAAQNPDAPYLHDLSGALDRSRVADDRERVFAASTSQDVHVLALLTLREVEVLECLHRRLSYQEIGEELFISAQTVKSHAGNIYDKLGVGSRREALTRARSLGWSPSA